MEITFRACGLHDLELLQKISTSTFMDAFEKQNDPIDFQSYLTKAFSKEQLQRELENENARFYFVETTKELVGYLKVNTGQAQSELRESGAMELERIYVIAAFQGKGLGKRMLSFAEELAVKEGKTYLWLGVWEKNQGAIRFYTRNGYQHFGTHPYYIGKDKQTDWLLKKELK